MPQDETIRRQIEEEEEEEEELIQAKKGPGSNLDTVQPVESFIQGSRGSGAQLPASERAFFEPRFGRDFGTVRVHTGANADAAAHSINAHAFTLGNDITFAAGKYRPGTSGGRRLLAHELTHTLQQEGKCHRIQRWSYGDPGPHVTGGGNTLTRVEDEEREGSNGLDRAMAIVDRLATGTGWRARNCQSWFDDNCTVARDLADLHDRAVIWMWRIADGSQPNGITDGGARENHAVAEQLYNFRSRWALAATILHEYWHDCEAGEPDIGDDAKAACGLPNI